jgi:hypothetical protein
MAADKRDCLESWTQNSCYDSLTEYFLFAALVALPSMIEAAQ